MRLEDEGLRELARSAVDAVVEDPQMTDFLLLAVTRADVADYVRTLALVYLVLIFIRIIMSWIPRMPYNRYLSAVLGFVSDVTDPYLNLFRKVLPPVRIGPGALDLQPDRRHVRPDHRQRDRRFADRGRRAAGGRDRHRGRGRGARPGHETARGHEHRPGDDVSVFPGLGLTNTRNTGVAFGARRGRRDRGGPDRALAGAARGVLPVHREMPWLWLPVGMLLGGALGNLADRARRAP